MTITLTDGHADGPTDNGRPEGQSENIMPPPRIVGGGVKKSQVTIWPTKIIGH